MTHFKPNDECPRDDDALANVQSWVLGYGDADERAAMERHLPHCSFCREEGDRVAALAMHLSPLSSPETPSESPSNSRLWLRLKDRMKRSADVPEKGAPAVQSWRDWDPEPAPGARVVPANSEDYERTGVEGITVRKLHVSTDRSEVTMLVRMEKGAAFPAHKHGGLERCLVLSGELHVGEQLARAGDYVMAEEGSLHPVQWTETGCELFITSSTSDELIDS